MFSSLLAGELVNAALALAALIPPSNDLLPLSVLSKTRKVPVTGVFSSSSRGFGVDFRRPKVFGNFGI